MNKSENIGQLSKALSSLQGEIEDLTRDKKGYGYKYADLAQCLQILRPLLKKNSLAIMQIPGFKEDRILLETILTHESGEWISGTMEIPITVGKGMIPAQACGSTISYARRYAIISHFGIAAEDDDLSSISKVAHPMVEIINDKVVKPVADIRVWSSVSAMIDEIKERLGNDEKRIEKICKFYNVMCLEELHSYQCQEALNKLNKTKETSNER